ncbi:hypothetical protein P154DRAFT_279909 [Amniculicola lignicola CBS 123094]|uniref:Cwf18 pre-mRNA splicing factor n=1 Tax=Amniculicola lignicola CBS 123094 TaxID=1392246 RepID=A0A6A5WBN0_9PLEO|nr:hypothetical protein P154DRAFT_279909 [Amniculicola lignicola CBS 123094]
MSSHEALTAAAEDRKSRLAQLKSLKRKAPPSDAEPSTSLTTSATAATTASDPDPATKYLSGRNYDPASRQAKLGYTAAEQLDKTTTLEYQAQQLAIASRADQEAEKAEESTGIDVWKLQPKKPNWDLKRDLEEKMRVVDVWSENAVARLVREKVEEKGRSLEEGKKDKDMRNESNGTGNGDEAEKETGVVGADIVGAMHMLEKEEEDERRREEVDGEADAS